MGQTAQKLVTAVFDDDGFGDDRPELRHAIAEPRGNPAAMKREICTSSSLNHSCLIGRLQAL